MGSTAFSILSSFTGGQKGSSRDLGARDMHSQEKPYKCAKKPRGKARATTL